MTASGSGSACRCLFAAGSSSEVSSSNKEVAWFDFLVEFGVEPVHGIFRHFDRVVGASLEAERNDYVRVHVIGPHPGSASDDRGRCWKTHRYLPGSTICPSKAEAAAV